MSSCNNCGKHRAFLMNNKKVCLRCDELLFDIEIECEEEIHRPTAPQPEAPTLTRIPLLKKV